jgi:Tol biopolymer transport system component/DNA-binding winged helix-turn-helix (wHTH) protein
MATLAQQRFFEFGEFQLDAGRRLLLRRGEVLPLTPKAFDILLVLVRNRARVVEKDELMRLVWPGVTVEENNLTRNISTLRKTLGEGPNDHRFIVTVPGRGYQFAAVVPVAMPVPYDAVETSDRSAVEPTGESESMVAGTAIPATGIPSRGQRHRAVRFALALAACALVVASAWLYNSHRREASLPSPRVVPVTSLPDFAWCSSISPDGNDVAFARHSDSPELSGIYIKQIGNDSYVQLTRSASDSCPAWSPDGRYLAFSRTEDQKRLIYLVSTLGGAARKVFSGTPAVTSVDWSPDGKFIAFSVANPEPSSYSISLLNLETLGTHKLTEPTAGHQDCCPAYSPDGKHLAFVRHNGNLTAAEIYVMSAGGGSADRLTFDDAKIIGPPAWTRDRKSLVFSSTRSGLATLWRIPASGGPPVQLTDVGVEAVHPTLPATGDRLAFEQVIGNSSLWRLSLTDIRKKDSRRQVTASEGFNGPAESSPDGKKIVFASDRSGNNEIYTCEADGSNLLRLTNLKNPGGHVSPRWSPDGEKIVFDSVFRGHTAIFVMEADGGLAHPLTDQGSDDVNPSWSHNGQWIYFTSNRTGQWQIWRIPSQGGDALQLTRQGGFGGFESADGKLFYYAKTPAHPDIWRVQLEDGQEAVLSPRLHLEDWTGWALVDNGIFFLQDTPEAHPMLSFLDFATAHIMDITPLQKQPWHSRVSASDDGQVVLYQQVDMMVSNVMLLENFR